MWFFLILGAILFLLMEHTVVFWVVFVPLIILFIASCTGFLRSRDRAIGKLITTLTVVAMMIAVLLIVCS
jgi:hypothetical protein